MDATENDNDFLGQSYSVTKLKKWTLFHTWVIEDFSLRLGSVGEFMESGTFTTDDGDSAWRLRLYPWGKNDYDYVYLQLVLISAGIVEAKGQVWVATANKTNEKRHAIDIRKFASQSPFEVYLGRRKDFLDKSGNFLIRDVLTLSCEVTTVKNCGCSCACTMKKSLQGPSLKDDFSAFFKNSDLSDMTLVSGDKRFYVHKAVLAARSPVFDAMFKHSMKEKQENQVQINDLTAEVVEEMLHFIYTDTVPNLSSTAEGLLKAAEKYDIKRLKYMCEQQLCWSIQASTAADVLRLADRFNAVHLKSVAVYYINTHAENVRKSEGWKAMVQKEPQLLECIYDSLFENLSNGESKETTNADP